MKRVVGVFLNDEDGVRMEVIDCFVGESVKEVIDKIIDYIRDYSKNVNKKVLEGIRKDLRERRSFVWVDYDKGNSYEYVIREEY